MTVVHVLPPDYDEAAARVWMTAHAGEYVDAIAGGVNLTRLAEAYADEAEGWAWLDDPEHPIWYDAWVASQAYDDQHAAEGDDARQ